MKLSNQALGSVMMALQKSLMEQSDITEVLKSFVLAANEEGELMVTNPPLIEVKKEEDE
tara:strand:+ start:3670 stop:3846 length:177 start_codon:yes stop_codon:yes gene_type:complete